MKMAAAPGPRQLALALDHTESFARDDFLESDCNCAALNLIDRWPDWPGRAIVLVGPAGSGKSHLSAIWAERAGARIAAARALDRSSPFAALATGALVLEDLTPGEFDEAALFHLLNLVREESAYLLITTTSQPAGWMTALPDLASRLRAIPLVTLSAPDVELLRALLVKLFADRQLAVDESLVSFLMTRLERSLPAARAAVERLDREAMQRKRPVSRALAAELYRIEPEIRS